MGKLTSIYAGRFTTGDYRAAFYAAVGELTAVTDMPVQFRISAVEVLTESYFQQTGRQPGTNELELLADFILRDELSDKAPDKVTNTPFPFLSENQSRTRREREVASDMTNTTADVTYRMNGRRARREVTA
ncbi:hypothetical protein [Paenibacillus sp. 1P03SA]|uniref:hypothetical protein n=1 Tax=Paenibacillus sp. 1P03SA TaxID=3132294 RepID=UPI0039A24C7A